MSAMLDVTVKRNPIESSPAHHVLATPSWKDWFSILPKPTVRTWKDDSPDDTGKQGGDNGVAQERAASTQAGLLGFRNPWPSWRKPSPPEVWGSFRWGEDDDPCVALAASHLKKDSSASDKSGSSQSNSTKATPQVIAEQASQLLRVDKPDFSFNPSSTRAKATWLGHAGVLVQLPPLSPGGDPIRCVFDPFFSDRASPLPGFGPLRSSPPPCRIEDLPPVDAVLISHNHFDHLDYATVVALWKANKDRLRFFVPLGNRAWFIESKIPADRVIELDWWESADLFPSETTVSEGMDMRSSLRITCTPAQHSSFRTNFDANMSLWAGWYLSHQSPSRPPPNPYRVFFAGDTGYQFHSPSVDWPPPPPDEVAASGMLPPSSAVKPLSPSDIAINGDEPACPAFAEIAERLGRPHLLILPVSVGGTYAYLRSFTSAYLSDRVNPFPRHAEGVTGAAHMPPWDAVRVLRIMIDPRQDGDPDVDARRGKTDTGARADMDEDEHESVALAIHWGTFVTDPIEVLRTLGQLEWACHQHGVQFSRAPDENISREGREEVEMNVSRFVALHQGQSIAM